MTAEQTFREQLHRACKLTGGRWAALWRLNGEAAGALGVGWGLTVARQRQLLAFLAQPRWATWVRGALTQGRTRHRKIPSDYHRLGERLYAFPLPQGRGVLLVGGLLPSQQQEVFRILALAAPYADGDTEPQAMPPALCRALTRRVGEEGYLPEGVGRALLLTVHEVLPYARAYVALEEEGQWAIVAAEGQGAETLRGQRRPLDAVPEFAAVRQQPRFQTWVRDPWPGAPSPAGWRWEAAPFVYGHRFLGVLVIGWAEGARSLVGKAFPHEAFLQRLTARASWLIDNALAFRETTRQLRRKVVANDILLTVLCGDDLGKTAQCTTRHLLRVLDADLAVVAWLNDGGRLVPLGVATAAPDVLVGELPPAVREKVLQQGQLLRIANLESAPDIRPMLSGARSLLALPLRYRGKIAGMVYLESQLPGAFTATDEGLLSAVAGQLTLFLDLMRLRQETAARARRMEVIHQVVQEVVGLFDEQEIVRVAAQRIAAYFDFEFVAVLIREGETFAPRLFAAAGSGEFLDPTDDLVPPTGVVAKVLATGESILINDTTQTPLYKPVSGRSWGSELCVPIFSPDEARSRVIGIINVERAERNAFDEEDRLALEAIAGVLSAVLAHVSRYHRLNTTVQHLQAARQTGLDIIADLDMQTLCQRIVRRVRTLLGVKGAEIGLVDQAQGLVRIAASENPWRDYTGQEIPLTMGVAGWVVSHGERLVLEDYNAWEGRSSDNPAALPAAFKVVASVPLKFKDEILGVLTVYDDSEGRVFTEEEVGLLELVAPQVAVALRNARLYQELSQRIAAQRQAEQELVRSARLAAVGELAAVVAHELTSPLTIITGFVELVLESLPPDHAAHEDLAYVLKEARRAGKIVRRLLDFTRRGNPMRLAADINALLEETLHMARRLLSNQGVVWAWEKDEDTPLVLADAAEIKQVFLNLLYTAAHAMPHGGKLSLRTFAEQSEGQRWAVVEVRGNAGDLLPSPMVNEGHAPAHDDKQPWSLATSFDIIAQHRGSLNVRREENNLVFVVRLPAMASWLPVAPEGQADQAGL